MLPSAKSVVAIGPHGKFPFRSVVVSDTETTGLFPRGVREDGSPVNDPHGPDRLCSVAAVRLVLGDGGWRIGATFHVKVDPCRPIPPAVSAVNGFGRSCEGSASPDGCEDLAGLPRFAEVAEGFLEFVAGEPLVFHNAAFDAAVLDAELLRCGLSPLAGPVACTKKAFAEIKGLGRPDVYVPGTNLNALCAMLGIDTSSRRLPDGREIHGALVDAYLAARCFIELEPTGWMPPENPRDLPHGRVADFAVRDSYRMR